MTVKKSISNKPIKDFIGPKEACNLLEYKYRGSFENAIKNGSLRIYAIGEGRAKYRAVYKPDVIALRKTNDKEEKAV